MHNMKKVHSKRSNLAGNRKQYRITTPRHHRGNKYTFQFHVSGGFDLKHRVNESCSFVITTTNSLITMNNNKKFLKFQMKTKGLLTSIMAPEASVKVGEMSSKSRLQINSKKKKKKIPSIFSATKQRHKKKKEREEMDYRRSLPEGWSNSKSKSKSNWEVSFWFWISLLLFIWSN